MCSRSRNCTAPMAAVAAAQQQLAAVAVAQKKLRSSGGCASLAAVAVVEQPRAAVAAAAAAQSQWQPLPRSTFRRPSPHPPTPSHHPSTPPDSVLLPHPLFMLAGCAALCATVGGSGVHLPGSKAVGGAPPQRGTDGGGGSKQLHTGWWTLISAPGGVGGGSPVQGSSGSLRAGNLPHRYHQTHINLCHPRMEQVVADGGCLLHVGRKSY